MAQWAHQHKDWLAQFLDLSNGIPSHDRLNMVFRRLKPAEFERCLLSWLAALHDTSLGRLLAIDIKTAFASFDTATTSSRPRDTITVDSDRFGTVEAQRPVNISGPEYAQSLIGTQNHSSTGGFEKPE